MAQLIKGESAFWINQNRLIKGKFVWQDDYWAVSVSESHLQVVREYIRNQEEHHRTKSFTEVALISWLKPTAKWHRLSSASL